MSPEELIAKADDLVGTIEHMQKRLDECHANHRRETAPMEELLDGMRAKLRELLPDYYKSKGIDTV